MVKSNQKIRKAVHILLAILLLISALCIAFIIILWARGAVIKPGLTYIPYGNGDFNFKGSFENFVEIYENPYQDDRVYLEFEYLGAKNTGGGPYSTTSWNILEPEETDYKISEDSNIYIIETKVRKLEKVYYLQPIVDKKHLSNEEKETEKEKERKGLNDLRIVCGTEMNPYITYYYQVKLPKEKEKFLRAIQYGIDTSWYGVDILINGKEIPAIYYSMAKQNEEIPVRQYYQYQQHSFITVWDGMPIEMPVEYIRQF